MRVGCVLLLALVALSCVALAHAAEASSDDFADESMALEVSGVASGGSAASTLGLTYNHDLANQLMFFSSAAYCAKNILASWTCPSCNAAYFGDFKPSMSFSSPRLDAFSYAGIAQTPEGQAIVLLMRGTTVSDWKSVLTDAEIWKAKHVASGGNVHHGFQAGWESIKDQALPEMKRLRGICQNCQVFVAGHSLGAAMATLAAASLVSEAGFPAAIVTNYLYGSPRVGDLAFKTWYDRTFPHTWRVTHANDLVPKVPPTFWPFNFIHVGSEVWYADDGLAYKQCTPLVEDNSCNKGTKLDVGAGVKAHLLYFGRAHGCDTTTTNLRNFAEKLRLQQIMQPSSDAANQAIGESILQALGGLGVGQSDSGVMAVLTGKDKGHVEQLANGRALSVDCSRISLPHMDDAAEAFECNHNPLLPQLFKGFPIDIQKKKGSAYCTFNQQFRACFVCSMLQSNNQMVKAFETCQSRLQFTKPNGDDFQRDVMFMVPRPMLSSARPPVKHTNAKPTAAKPTAAKPSAARPTAARPTAARPTAARPAAVRPAAVRPAAAKPKPAHRFAQVLQP